MIDKQLELNAIEIIQNKKYKEYIQKIIRAKTTINIL